MWMLGVGIGDACLRRAVSLRSSMECAHPPNLMSADPLGCASHSLRPDIGLSGQDARQHGRDIFLNLTVANMSQCVCKAGPFLYLPHQVGYLHQPTPINRKSVV